MSALTQEIKRYTYKDYVEWDTEIRYELFEGIPYAMSAPSENHQRLVGNVHLIFGSYLEGKPCRVRVSPYDVRLNPDEGDDTVFQPDVLVVCDNSKITKGGLKGAPDIAVEVMSPSNRPVEIKKKEILYARAGVKELWLIDPEERIVMVGCLNGNAYEFKEYKEDMRIASKVLAGLDITADDIFSEDLRPLLMRLLNT